MILTSKPDQLDPAIFLTMLKRGRGAALMHVLAHGLDGVEDMVLQACLSNRAYDPQCEHQRAPWLYRMFKGTAQYDRFSQAILAALGSTTAHWDLTQLCDLAALMAIDGDAHAASTLRDFVWTQAFSLESEQFGCEAVVRLDGMAALAELARRFGTMLLADPTAHVRAPDDLMDGFEDQPAPLAELEQLAIHDPALDAYLACYRRDLDRRQESMTPEERQAAQRERIRKQYSIDYILASAASGKGGFPGIYRSFGIHATTEELEMVLQQLLATTSPPICQRLLWVFNKAAMPRIDARIWELAEHEDEELRDAANRALSRMRDPQVGSFGRRKLRDSGLGAVDPSLFDLFAMNFLEGDAALIQLHLEHLLLSDERTHALSVLDICRENASPSLAGLAEWTYMNTPCSVCRKDAVEQLIVLSGLTPALANECLFDADRDIQALARSKA
jgi:hypothetical protein